MRAKAKIAMHGQVDRLHPPAVTGESFPVKFAGVEIGLGVVSEYRWEPSSGCWAAIIDTETME